MNSTAKAIRYWLMKRPRPAFVVIVSGKEKSEMTFDARTSFARTAESLEAMDADQLQALDPERKLIRACKPGELEEPEDAPEAVEPEPPPAGAVATDPETARFVLVANLLADAYRHSTEVAFARLAEIADRQTRRTESTERTIESLRKHMLAEALERAEDAGTEQPDLATSMISALSSGLELAKAAKDQPAAPTNGKGH